MKHVFTCLLALGLLAGPGGAQAVTSAAAPGTAPMPAVRQGAVSAGGAVESGARSYALTRQTQYFDRKGAPLAALRLAAGTSVAFTATAESSPKVRQVWLIN